MAAGKGNRDESEAIETESREPADNSIPLLPSTLEGCETVYPASSGACLLRIVRVITLTRDASHAALALTGVSGFV